MVIDVPQNEKLRPFLRNILTDFRKNVVITHPWCLFLYPKIGSTKYVIEVSAVSVRLQANES